MSDNADLIEWKSRREKLRKTWDDLYKTHPSSPRLRELSDSIDRLSAQIANLEAQRLGRLTVAWTGKVASFASIEGKFGEIPHSELAIHTQVAGKQVVRYCLFEENEKVVWVHVLTEDGVVVDGLPNELLPWGLRAKHKLG
jgi:hypothetical protein